VLTINIGEKLRNARNALDLKQTELAEKVGITERSIYNYEQGTTYPKPMLLKKLAEALNVSVTYLMDEEESDRQKNIDQELFIANAKNEYGYKGAREASELIQRTSALFAGGELDEGAKDIFIKSVMEIYLESKAEARRKYSHKKKSNNNDDDDDTDEKGQ